MIKSPYKVEDTLIQQFRGVGPTELGPQLSPAFCGTLSNVVSFVLGELRQRKGSTPGSHQSLGSSVEDIGVASQDTTRILVSDEEVLLWPEEPLRELY